jgi:Mor family transcriptional regulator
MIADKNSLPEGYHPTLVEIHAIILNALASIDLNDPLLSAFIITEHLRSNMGGTSPYIPLSRKCEMLARDREIYHKHTGDNINELAHEYKLSAQCIYSIISRVGKLERKKRQRDLFQ